MIRLQVDDELLDIPTDRLVNAITMARMVRPGAVVVSDTAAGPNELAPNADTDLYDGDKVANWDRPGDTGEIVETQVPRMGPRGYYVRWPGVQDPTPHYSDSLIRITKPEDRS